MTILSNYRFWILLLLPFICFVVVYLVVRKPTIDISTANEFSLTAISDSVIHGNSECSVVKENNTFRVNFELKEGYAFPYAGVQITRTDGVYYDLTDYVFQLQIVAQQDLRTSLRLNQFLPGYSDSSNSLSFVLYSKTFVLKKGDNTVHINANDVNEVPEWWFNINPKKVNDLKSFTLRQTQTIWIYADNHIPLNTPISYTIGEFKLVYNIVPLLHLFLLISLLYYIVLLIFWKFRKQTINYILLPIEPIKIPEKNSKIQTAILTYIATNYQNSQLKIADVSMALGISDEVVSEVLKQYLQVNFRQYLNKIRMEEAKRLLYESQLQISEIAFAVGYNNIQHFNRVFKEYTSFSPKAFREQ